MIKEFQGEYRFLSNFWYSPFSYHNINFATVEHFYQSLKCLNPEDAEMIRTSDTPGKAKRLGAKVSLVNGWSDLRLKVMRIGVTEKFRQNENLRQMLLDTFPHELYEGNTWRDTFWGVIWNPDGGFIGQNNLGKILMDVRSFWMFYEKKER